MGVSEPGAVARLTIGAFASACGLSAKALRRYDELGLLTPAYVDAFTGYRYYRPEQLERARLVAWLRHIGMPLARIRLVCDLFATDPPAAGREVEAYWARVEAETAARRDLAAFLVEHLTGGPTDRPEKGTAVMERSTLGIRYASRTERGLVREVNQDAVYAGERLFAVADGFGRDGAPAGEAAIGALRAGIPAGAAGADLLNVLAGSMADANRAVERFEDSGTTLTAMAWTGSQLALVHIGDTRAYLLRDGELFLVTHDHTVVQSMVDAGDLDAAEAASHPQRAMLVRALTGGDEGLRADVRLQDVRAGDRYLLCSKGLSVVVAQPEIDRTLTAPPGGTRPTPQEAVHALTALAHEAGAPDNVACVVADVVAL